MIIKHQLNKLFLALLGCCMQMISYALPTDATAPYHVVSDTMTYEQKKHLMIYEGHVHGTQGSAHLNGDRVLVLHNKQHRIAEIIAYGNPAHYDTLPALNKSRLYASATVMFYYPQLQKILLLGHGVVIQAPNSFTGDRIWYDIAHQTVLSTNPTSHGKTSIIIQPQDTQ